MVPAQKAWLQIYISSQNLDSEPQTHVSKAYLRTPHGCLMRISSFRWPKPSSWYSALSQLLLQSCPSSSMAAPFFRILWSKILILLVLFLSFCIFFTPYILFISRSCELYLQNILEPLFTTPPTTVFLGHHYLPPRLLQSPPKWSLSFHILPSPFSGYYPCSFLRDPAET